MDCFDTKWENLIKQPYLISIAALDVDYIEKSLAGVFQSDLLRRISITGSFPEVKVSFPHDYFGNDDVEMACKEFGSYCYSRGGESLAKVALDLLRERKGTLSVAESITGGMLASSIVAIPGASDLFDEGFVTYSNTAKTRSLGVEAVEIKKHGAVSSEVCVQMAYGAASETGTDYALSTTGIAGPGGSVAEKSVGLCYIGLYSPGGVYCAKYQYAGGREEVRKKAVFSALDLLRLNLEGYEKRLRAYLTKRD